MIGTGLPPIFGIFLVLSGNLEAAVACGGLISSGRRATAGFPNTKYELL